MAPTVGTEVVERPRDLVNRARRVLPDPGPFGSVLAVEHDGRPYPQFGDRAEGSRIWDTAGNGWVDWFLGGGAVVLGHRHPAVDSAIEEQLRRGANLSLRSPLEVDVAERICEAVPGVEQVAFAKNGTDVTSAAVRLARAVTGRDHVLISGYHGFADWSKGAVGDCAGVPPAVRDLVHEFGYDDIEGARSLLRSHAGEVAAIVVEPIRFAEPDPQLLPALRSLADEHGCLLVLDEVVTAFRVARGGVQAMFGVQADLVCLAKGLANGLPLAALAGPRRWLRHLGPTDFSMTYRRDALSLAAARAALDVHAEIDVAAHLADIGGRLRAGFAAAAARVGLDWSLAGHPSMLHLDVSGKGRVTERGAVALFVECCQRRGVYVEPYRLLPSLAHTASDVDETVAAMAEAMSTVVRAAADGLEAHLDSPVWADLEEAAPHPPVEWVQRRARLDLSGGDGGPGPTPTDVVLTEPAAVGAHAAVENGRLALRVDEHRRAPVTCGATISTPVPPPYRVTARYRIGVGHDESAEVCVDLECRGVDSGTTGQVTHQSTPGQPAWSQALLDGRFEQAMFEYGVAEGSLVLEHDGTTMKALHGPASARPPDLVSSRDLPDDPVFVTVRLRVTDAAGPVEVQVLGLTVEHHPPTVGSPPTTASRPSRRGRFGRRGPR